MDWFFETAPVKAKQRVHFHAFMLGVHAKINLWRKMDISERRASADYVRGAGEDPIAPTAKSIARNARLLCFDEFHVTDITDAMILSRLFSALWARGVIIVATDADAGIDATWRRLIGPATPRETCLTVQGRPLTLRRTAAGTARASFDRLCKQPLGAADYLRLSQAFQTLILENVPQMGPESRNEAKRFVTLIDALYETRTKLVMSAAVEPHLLS